MSDLEQNGVDQAAPEETTGEAVDLGSTPPVTPADPATDQSAPVEQPPQAVQIGAQAPAEKSPQAVDLGSTPPVNVPVPGPDSVLAVKHPTALFGNLSVKFHNRFGKEIEIIDHALENGIMKITEEMGGKDLVDFLVRHQGFSDVSKYVYQKIQQVERAVEKVIGWELKIPGASDEKKIDSTVGVDVPGGGTAEVKVIQNIATVKDPAVKQELLNAGYTVVRALTENE